MSRPSQKDIIMDYVRIRGSITPATMSDADKAYFGREMFLGSETGKRCRELRAEGKLQSMTTGKFETFYLARKDSQTGFLFGGVLMEGV